MRGVLAPSPIYRGMEQQKRQEMALGKQQKYEVRSSSEGRKEEELLRKALQWPGGYEQYTRHSPPPASTIVPTAKHREGVKPSLKRASQGQQPRLSHRFWEAEDCP
jgi:hypothetical protein